MLEKQKYPVSMSLTSDFGINTLHGKCSVGYDTIEISYSYDKMTFSELDEKMKEICQQLDEKDKIIEKLKKLK